MAGPSDGQIKDWFHFHPGTPVTGPQHDKVRQLFQELAHGLLELLPAGADRTLALRKAQEAMWASNSCVANAGIQ